MRVVRPEGLELGWVHMERVVDLVRTDEIPKTGEVKSLGAAVGSLGRGREEVRALGAQLRHLPWTISAMPCVCIGPAPPGAESPGANCLTGVRKGKQRRGGVAGHRPAPSPSVTRLPFSGSLSSKLTHLNQTVLFHSEVFFLDQEEMS